jgi:hypothetical protein
VRRSPELGVSIRWALAALERLARPRSPDGFAALAAAEQRAALRELEAEQPGLLPGLLFHTYAAYYQHPRVLAGLGREPRPPHPEGYAMETGDLGLLDPVRSRGEIYRKA